MEGLELICFNIIASVGTARSCYIEAYLAAKNGKIDEARALINQGDEIFIQGHHAHAELIQKEASGETLQMGLLLIHAEDQLMSAEAFKHLSLELIEIFSDLRQIKSRLGMQV